MKNKIKRLTFIIIILQISGCSVSYENFPEQDKLKNAIAHSIEIPFEESDTVIYESIIKVCGNSSENELNRLYSPQLDESPYAQVLIDNYKGKIWFTGDELNKIMDSICQGKEETVWSCFSKNKIHFNLIGTVISNISVEISEQYYLNNKIHSTDKIFSYKNGLWNYQIIKNELKE